MYYYELNTNIFASGESMHCKTFKQVPFGIVTSRSRYENFIQDLYHFSVKFHSIEAAIRLKQFRNKGRKRKMANCKSIDWHHIWYVFCRELICGKVSKLHIFDFLSHIRRKKSSMKGVNTFGTLLISTIFFKHSVTKDVFFKF